MAHHRQPAKTYASCLLGTLSRQVAEKKWEEAKGWVLTDNQPKLLLLCEVPPVTEKPIRSNTSKSKERYCVSVLPTEGRTCPYICI